MSRRPGRSPFERPTRPDQQPAVPATRISASKADAPPPRAAVLDPQAPPPSVRLLSPFAYVDEAGEMHGWLAGQIVSAAAEVALLIRRGAFVAALGPAPYGDPHPPEETTP